MIKTAAEFSLLILRINHCISSNLNFLSNQVHVLLVLWKRLTAETSQHGNAFKKTYSLN